MKRFLLGTTCTALLCNPFVAVADEGEEKAIAIATAITPVASDDDATEAKDVTIAVVTKDDDDDDKANPTTATFKIIEDDTITIVVDGKKHEMKKSEESSDVVKKIEAIIEKVGDGAEATATAKILGRAVIIGPDGEKKEFKFGDGESNKEMIEDLPKEIQIRVEKAMKGLSKGNLAHGIMIGPDGVQKKFNLNENAQFSEVLKGLPEEARKKVEQAMKGSITLKSGEGGAIVIGTDGTERKYSFSGDIADLKDLKDLEVLQSLPGKLRYRIERSTKAGQAEEEVEVTKKDSLAEKLDMIIKRLDKIEDELQSLKK